MSTVRVYDQVALDLRALPRGARICTTPLDEQSECAQVFAFIIIPA